VISRRIIEFWVGLFTAAGCAALFMLAMQVSNLSSVNVKDSYQLKAYFDDIGGLSVHAPVKVSGVLVGRVSAIGYNNERQQAEVTLSIEKRFDKFSKDTRVRILTAGLLGEQFIGLFPQGIEEDMLKDGDSIQFADPALSLESLIDKIAGSKLNE